MKMMAFNAVVLVLLFSRSSIHSVAVSFNPNFLDPMEQ